MLSKGSNALLSTISKSSLLCGKESDRGAGEDLEQQSSLNALISSKPPYLPQQVIVGFDIRPEPKPFDPCESPRSVLDVNVVPRPHGGSFRSFLGPLRNRGSQGVGLAIIVELQAEGKGDQDSLTPVGRRGGATEYDQAHHHGHSQTQPIAIRSNSKDKQCASGLSKYLQVHGSTGGDLSSVGSEMDMECVDPDYPSLWQEHLKPGKTSGDAEDVHDAHPSIFSVASLPSSYGSIGLRSSFLDTCAFCKRAFSPGKDVFMYRGDQAFCSVECRMERMNMVEHKEKCRAFYSK